MVVCSSVRRTLYQSIGCLYTTIEFDASPSAHTSPKTHTLTIIKSPNHRALGLKNSLIGKTGPSPEKQEKQGKQGFSCKLMPQTIEYRVMSNEQTRISLDLQRPSVVATGAPAYCGLLLLESPIILVDYVVTRTNNWNYTLVLPSWRCRISYSAVYSSVVH